MLKSLARALVLACLACVAASCSSSSDAPQSHSPKVTPPNVGDDPRIVITSSDPVTGIAGSYLDVSFQITSTSINERNATFTLGSMVVSIEIDDTPSSGTGSAAPPSIQAGSVAWTSGSALSQADGDAVRAIVGGPLGEAILNTSAGLYWKDPRPALLRLRTTAVQLYQALAVYYDDAAKHLTQPAGTILGDCQPNPCEYRTDEALFGCTLADGTRKDVIVLTNGLSPQCAVVGSPDQAHDHDIGSCYGGCGKGCLFCKTVRFACTGANIDWAGGDTVNGASGTSQPTPCFDIPGGAYFYPFYDISDRPDVCASAYSHDVGSFEICTSAAGCYAHDECLGHDSGSNWVVCNAKGAELEDPEAAWGRPKAPFGYKAFAPSGLPISVGPDATPIPNVGVCNWLNACDANGCAPVFTNVTNAPVTVDQHQTTEEHAKCLVHQCKHSGDHSYCDCATDADCPAEGIEDPPEKSCIDGRCANCAFPKKACSGKCIDVSSDASNCGVCGKQCPAPQTCSSGLCRCAADSDCPSPQKCVAKFCTCVATPKTFTFQQDMTMPIPAHTVPGTITGITASGTWNCSNVVGTCTNVPCANFIPSYSGNTQNAYDFDNQYTDNSGTCSYTITYTLPCP